MKFEAYAVAPTVIKFRQPNGEEVLSVQNEQSGPNPACVRVTAADEEFGCTFSLTLEQAEVFASKLADAVAAARALPVQERVLGGGR